MCNAKPGTRCLGHATRTLESGQNTYRDAHPEGPDVTPLPLAPLDETTLQRRQAFDALRVAEANERAAVKALQAAGERVLDTQERLLRESGFIDEEARRLRRVIREDAGGAPLPANHPLFDPAHPYAPMHDAPTLGDYGHQSHDDRERVRRARYASRLDVEARRTAAQFRDAQSALAGARARLAEASAHYARAHSSSRHLEDQAPRRASPHQPSPQLVLA